MADDEDFATLFQSSESEEEGGKVIGATKRKKKTSDDMDEDFDVGKVSGSAKKAVKKRRNKEHDDENDKGKGKEKEKEKDKDGDVTSKERRKVSSAIVSPKIEAKKASGDDLANQDQDKDEDQDKEQEKDVKQEEEPLKGRTKDDDDFIDDTGVAADADKEDADDRIRTDNPSEDESGEEGDNQGDADATKTNKTKFDQRLEEHKRQKKRKEVDPKKVEAACISLVDKMADALTKDMQDFKEGKPAINKMRMLDAVERFITKVDYRDSLLSKGFLAVIRGWIDLLPDGDMPNITMRMRVFAMLDALPVDVDWPERLNESNGLGRLINYYAQKDPYLPAKRIAQKVLDKWSRIASQVEAEEEEIETGVDPKQERSLKLFQQAAEYSKASEYLAERRRKASEDALKYIAKVPEKMALGAFVHRPESDLSYGEDEGGNKGGKAAGSGARAKRLEKTLKELRESQKKGQTRAVNVSIQGRDLHQ